MSSLSKQFLECYRKIQCLSIYLNNPEFFTEVSLIHDNFRSKLIELLTNFVLNKQDNSEAVITTASEALQTAIYDLAIAYRVKCHSDINFSEPIKNKLERIEAEFKSIFGVPLLDIHKLAPAPAQPQPQPAPKNSVPVVDEPGAQSPDQPAPENSVPVVEKLRSQFKKVDYVSRQAINIIPPLLLRQTHLKNGESLQILTSNQKDQINKLKAAANAPIKDRLIYISRKKKSELGLEYSIISIDGKDYSIYPGKFALLGEGSFGKAKLMQNCETLEWVVLKVIRPNADKKIFDPAEENSIEEERKILGKLKLSEGNNLLWKKIEAPTSVVFKAVDFVKYFLRKKTSKAFLAMKFIKGVSLEKLKRTNLPSIRWLEIFMSAVKEMAAIHTKNILHRDIKPENLIWDASENKVTFIDFGVAVSTDNCTHSSPLVVGTPGYLPEEFYSPLASGIYTYDTKTDIFSLGRTMLDLIPDSTKDPILKNARELAAAMAAKDINERPTAERILRTLNELEDVCLKISGDPKRIGIVSLSELVDGNGKICEQFFIPLSAFDKVWILAPNNQSIVSKEILLKLSQCDINVAGTLSSPDIRTVDAIIADVPLYLEEQAKTEAAVKPQTINSYFHVTAEEKVPKEELNQLLITEEMSKMSKRDVVAILDAAKVSERHFQFMIGGLQGELARLKSQKTHMSDTVIARRQAIQTSMKSLQMSYQSNTLNYSRIHTELVTLQTKMVHTNVIKNNFATFFGLAHGTRGAENIYQLALTIPHRPR